MNPIVFTVYGKPATQGSKRAFVIKPQGGGTPRAIVTENDKRCQPWRQEVAAAAAKAYDGPLIIGPVRLRVEYVYVRPKSHYGTGRNAEIIKASAPYHKTTIPDLSKLTRAIEDALSGVLYRSDSLIAERHDSKRWGIRDRATITVEPLSE